ncbi:alpha-2-macroglobulin family protein [Caldilinea sp.]|uniref:alpha-2-macroglobulin family protein n=1 Tax=Caldilinea sp. TaxID=2293560 RepID=UPI002B928B7A|nr:alpha-2-macroglobulin family protein [Caldilinea sp.]
MYVRFISRRTLLTLVSTLVVVSIIAGAGWPAGATVGATVRGDSRPVAGLQSSLLQPPASPISQEGMPVSTNVEPTPATINGLEVLLGEGVAVPQPPSLLTRASSQPLAAAAVQPILERMPPIEAEATDVEPFKLPPQSLPPVTASEVVTQSFPPPDSGMIAPEVSTGPLAVLRYAPEGEIPIAPFINVTFNQPMVPLNTLDALAAEDVPVKVTPDLPGVWKWLGAQTLSFEYHSDDLNRFPMATEYTVEVPAGTTSATGGILEDAVTWNFRTPAPTAVQAYPTFGPQPRAPLLFVAFDQRIDRDAVLATMSALAGGRTYALRLATAEEIAADKEASHYAARYADDRWLAFRAEEAFPADATVTINMGPGTPSAEGPLTTTDVQSFSFQTYAALRVVDQNCRGGSDACSPGQPFYVRFNNPLNVEKISNDLVTVEPAIDNMVVSGGYDSLSISGLTAGRATYQVTLSDQIEDIFGQTLGEPVVLTFYTGSMSAFMTGPNQTLITLDPTATTPAFPVYSVNMPTLRVRGYAVTPEDWPAYLTYLNEYYRDPNRKPPGRPVIDATVDVDAEPDTLTETNIDLTAALNGRFGHVIVVIDTPPSLLGLLFPNRYEPVIQSWVQVTNIGLDAIHDQVEMAAWATALDTGEPLAGVALTLLPNGQQATTDSDGMAHFELASAPDKQLVAQLGDDVAFLPQSTYYWSDSGWQKVDRIDQASWFVFDDRQMYRPTEEVHLKGWMRTLGAGPTGDVRLDAVSKAVVDYVVTDPQGNQIAQGAAPMTDLGGFDLAFTIPENSNLGYASVQLSTRNTPIYGSYYHSFQIQEFRRPEFEVTARNESTGPYYLGDEAIVAVSAQYYAGGPLPGADATWNVSADPTSYTPPNWSDFIFGEWTPWWWYGGRGGGYIDYYAGPDNNVGSQSYATRTDPTGNHYLKMTFIASEKPQPYSVNADAAVMDVNRQTWAAQTNLIVHPSKLYVGLRSDAYFAEQGDPLEYAVIVTDVDGNVVVDVPVSVRSVRLAWVFEGGKWVQQEVDEQRCDLASADEPVQCSLPTGDGGEYRVTAEVRDDAERLNRTVVTAWVSGGARVPSRDLTQQELVLVPDKENYTPGDAARILVQAPFATGSGLLTVARSGILYTENFSLDGGTATLEIPIEEAHLPNLNIQVDVNGMAPRLDDKGKPIENAPAQPAYATGTLQLNIPPLSRALTVEITPDATSLDPGAETGVTVQVTDAQGAPVEGAELAIVVVDEAVLALTGYQLADPLATFYSARSADISSYYGRNSLVLANPDLLAAQNGAGGMGGEPAATATAGMVMEDSAMMAMPAAAPAEAMEMEFARGESAASDQAAATPIGVRTDFNALALFAPAERTGADGMVYVTYKLPDNLTRYRLMVVAVTEKQFGSAESNLTARLPLMVRPSAPRFLNFGDHFELPVVVQNQTDAPMTVDVVAEATNLRLDGAQGQRIEVPANDRVEVRFAASTDSVGTARVQFAAVSGDYADAATADLPVYTPATTEAFATYGVLNEGAVAQPIAQPQDVFPQFGGLELSTSSTALATLTDAFLYLQAYPFECSEQLGARIMSVAALRDVLTAFQSPDLPSDEAIVAAMQRDIATLRLMQNWDGGFPYWTKGRESIPYNSVFVTHALVTARMKDYAVPQEMLDSALSYLRTIEQSYPAWYSAKTRHVISSYAVYVRNLMGDADYIKARDLSNQLPLDEQSLEAQAWLWQVLADDPAATDMVAAMQRNIQNRAVETPGAANFITSYDDQEWVLLHSNRRTDAIVLDALIQETPASDLIPKVVAGLMNGRTNGRWSNTQENVFVLLAMDRYFNTFETSTPDFVARMWLGDAYVAEHTHEGRTTETQQSVVPMSLLVEQPGTQDLVISKEGDGRLYYRLGLRYAPTDLGLDPLDRGFVVQRTYEAVDDPTDVRLDDDGVWHVKAGARVRIRLTLVAVNRRYHVALVDRLPAGLEIINPDLAVSESVPDDPNAAAGAGGYWRWWGPWYDHQNLRDAGAEAFTPLLWDGVYNYSYVARATTPGEFVTPPAKAEEMYSPEVFGRSASDRVIVE